MAHPSRRPLFDLADQFAQCFLKLVFCHVPPKRHFRPIGLLGLHLLDCFDHIALDKMKLAHLNLAPRTIVDLMLQERQVKTSFSGRCDFQDERPPTSQHPGVDILPPCRMKRMFLPLSCLQYGFSNKLLDALRIRLARIVALPAAAPTTGTAGPLRLRDAPHQLAIAPVDEERIDMNFQLLPPQIQQKDNLRLPKIYQNRLPTTRHHQPEAFSNFAIELLLDGLHLLYIDLISLPERLLCFFNVTGNPRSHKIRLELIPLDAGESPRRPAFYTHKQALADAAILRLGHLAVLTYRQNDAQSLPALLVGQPAAASGKTATQTAITDSLVLQDLLGFVEQFAHSFLCRAIIASLTDLSLVGSLGRRKMRILALDLGEKRIGLAISDETETLARGLAVYVRRSLRDDLEYLKGVVQSEGVERIVLGLPVNMDGSLGPKAQQSKEFQRQLLQELKLPVELFDERLTTAEAERVLVEAGLSRQRRKEIRDQQAAVLILQGYLDHRRRLDSTAS